ncbi:hypothetical protein COCNU_11G005330 [Cocos nucifera]|uniref:DUF7915 domain-containing protein n=1 Tax=Cocos nucifera TaxID=13894 RepID=A0A8K0INW0_COCNU|nr:hypothetical protein COCNU_11G005330 [Cocos nucifera]
MDACNISEALDASNNAPNVEGWPICKVAVFLINHTKERCLLQFGSLTQGVWSLLEQELEEPIDNQVGGTQMNKNASKNRRIASGCSDGSSDNDYVLQQLAFSILEQKAGISRATCCILEHHSAYSLSQKKTTTRLYIMKYTEAVSEELREINIKDVISSLRGPLLKKAFAPEVTPVVEHYNLLPYADILSDWLNREALHDGSLHLPTLQADVNKKCPLLSDRLSIVEDPETDNKSDWGEQTVDKMSNTKNETITKNQNSASSRSGPIQAASRPKSNSHILSMEPDKSPKMEDEVVSDKSLQNEQTMDMLSHKSRIRKAVTNSVATDGPNMSGSFTVVCRPHNDTVTSSLNQNQQPLVNKEDMWRENDILYSPTIKRKKNNIQDTADVTLHGCNEKENMADSTKPCTTKGIDGELLGKTDTGDSVQCRKASFDLPLVPLQINMENQAAFQLVASKKESSLRVLQKRRDDLELDDICCENSWTLPRYSVLPSISDDIIGLLDTDMPRSLNLNVCLHLNEELAMPSAGRFQASVTVKGMDFECTVDGDLKSNPCEARESAATNMLSRLRIMAGQAQ